jgi:molybdopterin molybdotransferase
MSGMKIDYEFNVLPKEHVTVNTALLRVAAEDVTALSACPPHPESSRDGYVLAFPEIQMTGDCCYPVVGENAAGTNSVSRLAPGSACRIFTGGLIPEGGDRVVPQEECCELEGAVRPSAAAMASARRFINEAGSEVKYGEIVIAKGTRLALDHLTLLAAVGVCQVPVACRPRVACYCTGNELVAVGEPLAPGQKFSLNSMLLQHLIPLYGGIITEQGIIADTRQALNGIFNALTDQRYDLVVSTGGMGPGKYDLVKDAFCRAGGRIILETLAMNPGRSILLGTIDSTVFLALPGPPHAVRTLVNELVGPIMLMLQGANDCWPVVLHARLLHDYRAKKSALPQIRGGVLQTGKGQCLVGVAGRLDPVSCFILFPAGGKEMRRGDMVEVHLCRTGFAGGYSYP